VITDQQIEQDLEWLRSSADDIGAAKANAVRTERMTKHIKALEMKQHIKLPVNAQEREAMASNLYLNAIENEAKAAGEYEKLKSLREAAAMRIDAWRTMSSNYRSMKI
jgi:hypothetical protein